MNLIEKTQQLQDELYDATKHILNLIRPYNQHKQDFPPEKVSSYVSGWGIDYEDISNQGLSIEWIRYYSCESENHRFFIPARYYEMSDEAIIEAEKIKFEAEEKEKLEVQAKVEQARAEEQKRRELTQLAALKAKYEKE